MSVTRPVVKTETLKKTKIKPDMVFSLPLKSGQLERWYFHLGASNGISVAVSPDHQSPQPSIYMDKCTVYTYTVYMYTAL